MCGHRAQNLLVLRSLQLTDDTRVSRLQANDRWCYVSQSKHWSGSHRICHRVCRTCSATPVLPIWQVVFWTQVVIFSPQNSFRSHISQYQIQKSFSWGACPSFCTWVQALKPDQCNFASIRSVTDNFLFIHVVANWEATERKCTMSCDYRWKHFHPVGKNFHDAILKSCITDFVSIQFSPSRITEFLPLKKTNSLLCM